MKFFYDTEFYEDGKRIIPISIGMVTEDGKEYYAEFYETLTNKGILGTLVMDSWHRTNTIPNLTWQQLRETYQIGSDLQKFVTLYADTPAEFWAYYGDYDHVLMAQIYGRMISLPKGFPMFTMDLKQYAVSLGDPELPKQKEGEHNALADAKWNREVYLYLRGLELRNGKRSGAGLGEVHEDTQHEGRKEEKSGEEEQSSGSVRDGAETES